jgi:hypothetical protein
MGGPSDSVVLEDGTIVDCTSLDDATYRAVLETEMPEISDRRPLLYLRDRVRRIHDDARKRRLSIDDLAVMLALELKGKRPSMLELTYIIAVGTMFQRAAQRAAAKDQTAPARKKLEEKRNQLKARVLPMYREHKALHRRDTDAKIVRWINDTPDRDGREDKELKRLTVAMLQAFLSEDGPKRRRGRPRKS